MKIMQESSDIFKYLKKVKMSDSEWLKARKTGKYITDGYGNIYEIPTEGYFPKTWKADGLSFRYNFNNKSLECFNPKVPESSKVKVIDSVNINPVEFFDNPYYYVLELRENIYNEFEV